MSVSKKVIFLPKLVIALATIISIMYAISCGSRNEVASFYRVPQNNLPEDHDHFRVDRQFRRLYFKKDNQETLLNEIPSIRAGYFYLRGKKQVILEPHVTGNAGFYSYLYLESLSQGKHMDLKILLYSGNDKNSSPRLLYRSRAPKVSFPLFKELTLREGDRISMQFQGRGIVYFSSPVFYSRLPQLKPQESASPRFKHIYFIGIDTFRGDQVGKILNGKPLTPNIKAFIKDSLYLQHTFSQTSWTLPSFMSLFTGLTEYNHEVGVKQALKADKPFLIEQMARDFVTFGIHGGKVMGGRWGFSRGFDYYKKYQPAAALYPRGGESLFGKALEIIDNSRFPNLFMFLHTYQVHAPYTPPEEFLLELNPTPKYKKLDLINFNEPQKTFTPLDDPVRKATEELYQAEIHAFDAFFGQFLQQLKARGLYDNAMIVLMSDHGEEFFDHKGWGHSHSLYNELIRVPAIIKFPGGEFGNRQITQPVAVMDLFPTLLSYYSIPYEGTPLDGRDLMPFIRGEKKFNSIDSKSPDYVVSSISTGRYFEALPPRIALMAGQYKLIYNEPFSKKDLAYFDGHPLPPQPPLLELYDLIADPLETRNLADSNPRIKKKLFPIIRKIRKHILKKAASLGGDSKKIEKEVEEQLKSLGYL